MPILKVLDSFFLPSGITSPMRSNFQNNVTSPSKLQIGFHIREEKDEKIADPKVNCCINLFGVPKCDENSEEDEIIQQNENIVIEPVAQVKEIPDFAESNTVLDFRRKVKIPCLHTKRSLRKLCARAGLKYNGETYDDNAEYEVEEIIEDSIENGVHWYLVKWQNYPRSEATWEPAENLSHSKGLLQDFNANKLFTLKAFTNGRVIRSTLQAFFKKVTRKRTCDVPTLMKICVLIGKPVDVELPITAASIKKVKDTALTILDFSHQRLEKHKEDLAAICDFYRRREYCLKKLKQWENIINLVDPNVRVTNDVDCDGPPKYKFIADYKYLNILHLNEPLVGCECVQCGSQEDTCCSELAGESFAYKDGKLRLLPGYPIYECNTLCKCDKTCANRVVQNGQKVKIEIFRTADRRGWGLRTLERIKKNQFVLEYIGEVITSEEADRRRYGNQHSYLFDLDFENNACTYTVDAKDYGNAAHFINHSCNPNMHVYAVWIDHLDPKLPRLAFFARRDIARYEELTFDYRMSKDTPFQSTTPTSSPMKTDPTVPSSPIIVRLSVPEPSKLPASSSRRLKCKCGAPKCRGYLF